MMMKVTATFDRRTRLHIEHLQEREQDAQFSKPQSKDHAKERRNVAQQVQKLYNACDSPGMSSLLFLHHFYLTLITKSYILYAATQSAIPQGLPPGNHPSK